LASRRVFKPCADARPEATAVKRPEFLPLNAAAAPEKGEIVSATVEHG
jgi:hypothetical protein